MLLLACAALRHARPGRPAATVLVLGLLLLGAAAAEAQTERILVSNAFQTADDSANTSGNDHAQLFHTGAHANGYTLTSVVVNSDDVEDDDFDVEVCEEDGTSDEFPSTAAGDCTALTAPATFVGVGNVQFTHTGLALSANTNYVVVIKQRGSGSVEIDSTTSSGEDSQGLSDWSIKNKFYWKSGSTWMIKSGSNEALTIIVYGYEGGLAPAVTDQQLAPSNLIATLENGDVRLNWNAPEADAASVTGYSIFRANPQLTPPAPLATYESNTNNTNTTFLDMAPVAGTRNTYRVAAWRGSVGSVNSNSGFVDVPPPSVSSVALTSTPTNATYRIGDAIEATVTFSEAVDITGTPQLELDFDGTAKAAACTAATNTTIMVCSYTVVAGDSATNGVAIAANKLTGGTITATGSTPAAVLTHSPVAIDAGHKVDGIRPTLVTTGSTAPTTSTDGTKVILTFSEDISAADRTRITIGIGGGNVALTSAANAAGPTVEIDLSTFIDATVMLTVELAADAVEDAAGNGILAVAATAVTNAITPEPPGRPAAPSVSSVAGSTTRLEVTWTAPANTGPAIDNYNLRYRQGTSGLWTNGPQSVIGTSATITGLTASTSYQVQVLARNADGDSPWSPSGSGQTNSAGNSAPTFANPTETRSVDENSPASTNVGAPVTATDGDNDPLTYTLEGTDAASFNIVSASGQIRTRSGVTYDYEATKNSYMVIVKADDNNGDTDTVTVTITLTDVDESPPGRIGSSGGRNGPPLAVDDAAETPEDTPVTIAVRANDSDPDGNTLTVVEVSAPTHGTAVVADTGAVVYTPEPDFHGTDRFTYVVGDGSGLTARAAVEVTVLPVNDPPLAGNDAADTPEDTSVTIDVLSNDSDVEGDALALVEASAPAHGSARLTDAGAVVYTPEPDFHGTDRFTYVVGDGSGLTAQAAVEVTVLPVNDPPLATGVIPDRTLDVGDGPAVLDLIPFFADRDGDALGYTAVVSDQAVALRLTGATLTLTATRPGTATVTVTAQDPGGLTATQAFMVTTTDHQARGVKAWLARFGRTVANHAVEAVRGRMSSVPAPSRRVTLGGAELKEPPAPEITEISPWDELTPEDQRPENLRSLRVREFLLSSSFEVPLAQNATQNPGPGWTAWGGAAQTRFSGRDSEVSIDGDVTTATLGVDRAWDRVLLGLALARSTGDGSYGAGDIRGDLKSSITSAHPYLRFSLNDRLSAWTLLGYGKGELTLTHSGGEERTDIEMKMAALGARGALLAAGGFDLSARSDALIVRTSSEGTSQMAETEADVSRLRLVLEGSRPLEFASGSSLTPSVEVGVRRDGGDAERGMGFEMGGAMRYANPSIGLIVEITARRLMAHERSGYSEWGAGGSVQFAPGGAEKGFSAKLGSSVGTAASGVEGLWAMGDTRGLAGGAQAPGRLDAEAGYAMGAFGDSGVITPYGGFSMSGDRRYRAGWRLRLGDSFNLSLEGDRTENPDAPSRHAVALRGDLRW